MEKQRIDFRTGSYFPSGMAFTGGLMVVAGLAALFAAHLTAGIILIAIGIVLATTHYRLEIDFNNRTYRDYVWFLGFRNGTPGQFQVLDYLFVKQIKQRQNLNSRISSKTITTEAFDGYLKFDGSETIHLFTKNRKADILKRLNKIAGLLELKVVDYSEEELI